MRESDGPNSNVVGEKLCKHKYSSYPYCYGEIASETQGNRQFFIDVKNDTRVVASGSKDRIDTFGAIKKIKVISILKRT